ncbi:MAG: mechanosensitive ion channel family protein [Proteobacteria bacterium]|nr:mechanosensitive ion channel family protein [Pseudomonadota bacterium]
MKKFYKNGFVILYFFLLCAEAIGAEAEKGSAVEKGVISLLAPVYSIVSKNHWAQGLTVILIASMVTSLLTWSVFKLLRKITSSTKFDLDDQIIILLRPPVYYSLLATGISAGLSLMPLSEKLAMLAGRSIKSVGVIIWIYFFTCLATLLLKRLAGMADKYSFIQHRTLTLFDNAAKVFIFGIGIYALFVIWQIDMTAWLASAGIAGIAVGFAAKDTLSNLFSGVFILADAPYKVGDYVVLDGGQRGKVINIGLRSTRILTRDDIEITVPNSIIGNTTIVNQSGGPSPQMRIRIKVNVAYGTDIDLVRKILTEIASGNQYVSHFPQPKVRFRLFGASGLDFELLCWIADPELRGRATDSLNDAIYKKFAAEKIEIPYAKQDLYIKGLPEALLLSRPEAKKDQGNVGE